MHCQNYEDVDPKRNFYLLILCFESYNFAYYALRLSSILFRKKVLIICRVKNKKSASLRVFREMKSKFFLKILPLT